MFCLVELQIQLSKRTSELESANRQMFQQRVEYVNKLDIVLDGVKVARESHAKLVYLFFNLFSPCFIVLHCHHVNLIVFSWCL